MIEKYSFGCITINGKKYTSDLIISHDGNINSSWWRKNGHILSADDIEDVIESRPDVIIAGTGSPGLMKPEKNLEKYLLDKGIEFISQPTKKACKLYNELYTKKHTCACLHLTC